jgi:hypothetical protein
MEHTSPIVAKTYQKFITESGSSLKGEHFITLLTFFPALLVIAADGVIDEEEWVYVKFMAKAMADTFRDELADKTELKPLEQQFLKDLGYILEHITDWKPQLMDTLRIYLTEAPDVKEYVLDALYMFADASDDVSYQEEETIDEIKRQLNISDD